MSQESKPYVPMDWEKYNKQKEIDEAKYAKLKLEVDETLQNTQKTIDSVSNTTRSIDVAIKSAQETTKKIDNFQQQFGEVMKALGEKLATAFSNMQQGFKAKNTESITAKQLSISEAKQLLKGKILILSGAGLSHASGIPTFRGEGGFWRNGPDTYECQKVLTKSFLDSDPAKCWQWHFDFQKLTNKAKPNPAHIAIANYFYKHKDIVLVTQNIDNLLTSCLKGNQQVKGLDQDIYEIHGNIKYMRCMKDCLYKLYDMPELEIGVIPKCPDCGEMARPHILFFDESYDDLHYRRQQVMDAFNQCEILIVIGSMLETGLSASMVRNAIERDLIILEINPEPIIEIGCTFTLKGKAEDILPKLLE